MAARNGYNAEQSSDLYITDGDQIDWLYGTPADLLVHLGALPARDADRLGRPLPAPTRTIAPQTARNRAALLYFLDARRLPVPGDRPGQVADCGPFFDDIEIARGWTVNPDGTDTATGGAVRPGRPGADDVRRRSDPARTRPRRGRYAFVTGRAGGRVARTPTTSTADDDPERPDRAAGDARAALRSATASPTARAASADSLRVFVEDDAACGPRSVCEVRHGVARSAARWADGIASR